MAPNQNTSDDTRSRRQSHTVSPDTTASSENSDGSAQIIRSPVALHIRHQLPSFVTTDSEHIQTQGQDAKDTTALPTPATGMRDSEREEISHRIRAIQDSAVALQTRLESAGGQALMQEIHAHIRDIQTYLVPQDGQENFLSEQTNRRHTYLTIGVRSPVYRNIDLSLTRLEAMMSWIILMTPPSVTEGQAAANSVNQQQNTGLADTGSPQSNTISEFSFSHSC